MTQPAVEIPSDVWNLVFGYLSVEDKFNVRASCKYFKKIVDHCSLWKDWTVVLSFKNGSYSSRFWTVLRRRKVTSVVMRSTKNKDWKRLSQCLPTLTTVVMDQSSQKSLSCLKDFPHLKRLALRSSVTALLVEAITVSQPELLTHLSICGVRFHITLLDSFVSAVSQFTNLISLVYHGKGLVGETTLIINSILACLPKLKHLSLPVVPAFPRLYSDVVGEVVGQAGTPALSSLELVNNMGHSLAEGAMRLMPGLNSLAVFYIHTHGDNPENWSSPVCPLKTWLRDLPQLSTLAIVKGPPVENYVTSIPATVTSLTLCGTGLTLENLAAIAVQVPNLLHLHIDTWPSPPGAHTAEIPKLFPQLKSLKLRHEYVTEKDFLNLYKLRDLEYLEILDNQLHLSKLTEKLQALTKHSLQIITSPRQRDVLSCPCVYQAC